MCSATDPYDAEMIADADELVRRRPVGPVAVTGASGLLGANVVRALLAAGRAVRAIDRQWQPTLAHLDIERIAADVTNAEQMKRALDGAGAVIHLAAVISVDGDPDGRVWTTNVGGSRTVASAALSAGIPMVHCSSVHSFALDRVAYGEALTEDSPAVGAEGAPYDRSKRAGEEAVRDEIDRGLDAVIVNPSGIIGPYDAAPSLQGRVLLAIARGRFPLVAPGGFDFVDARDVAASVAAALDHGRTGRNYLIGGHYFPIAELAAGAAEVFGTRAPMATVPASVAAGVAPVARWATRALGRRAVFTPESLATMANGPVIDSSRAANELGHRARPMATTLADTHAWFRTAGFLT